MQSNTLPNGAADFARKAIRRCRSYSWSWQKRFRTTTTVRTTDGTFTIFLDDVIGWSIYVDRRYESAWTDAVFRHLRAQGFLPGDRPSTVVDIGANIGVSSIGMLVRGDVTHAVAIEPSPNNFELLTRNIRQNGLEDRFCALPIAASDHTASLQFELSETNTGDHRVRTGDGRDVADGAYAEKSRRVISVPTRPLDEIVAELPKAFADSIRLIWIDVQGHELHVFRGAAGVFRRGVPVVSEVWPYGLLRAGTGIDAFCEFATAMWRSFSVLRDGDGPSPDLERQPISQLRSFVSAIEAIAYRDVVFLP